MSMDARAVGIAMLALFAAAGSAGAQVISGVVLEDGRDLPIAGALVQLIEQSSGEVRAAATTAAEGEFEVRAPAAGPYRLRISRIGYLPVTTAVDSLAAGDSVHHRLTMPRAPLAMDTLRVESSDRQTGFDKVMRRQRENNGIFIPGAIIEAANPPYPAQYLQYLIGALFTTRDGRLRMPGARCTVLWIDEWRHRSLGLAAVDRLQPADIAAIEVYRTYRDVPKELQLDVYPCGLVNIWTRAAW